MNQPVRHGAMRARNLALVLGEIAGGGPLTRAALAELTGLTKTTVSSLVADLLSAGLVAQAPAARGGERGRPGVEVRLSGEHVAALGLEVNVDYLAACLVDLTGAVRARRTVRADNRASRPEPVLAALDRLAGETLAGVPSLRVAGAVLAVPGTVGERRVHHAPHLGWRNVETADIAARLSVAPVAVENEANLAALGELEFGAAPRDFLYVSGEIGVGAGLVRDGGLLRGSSGLAGELGHVVVTDGGPACRCGSRGCLEVYAGRGSLPDPASLAADDPRAAAACRRAGRALGLALSSAVNLLDPGTIVLGGCYVPLFPWLAPAVEAVLDERLGALRPAPPALVPAVTGPDAAVLGAAGQVLRRVLADPASLA
ncbi:ROK family transcriptional regulator [Actinocorallia sp. B10E7]|uniref:ROK family transcriptional regulator n=1 Tax=Actinocorallia sp. B10E7 TaxID=3153558 RepID=UPI00325C383D